MRSILFVDDDPNVLQGLERMLHPMCHEWNMAFAESGEAALKLLAGQPFDVVVSDMRMPRMDGVQLLTEVMRRYPHVVRIALSGHTNRGMVLRSVGTTHQYLAKPCDAETLQNTVARACALHELLADESLKRLISGMTSLPSLPDAYLQVVEELRSPEVSARSVGAIISQDVGMTAKILQLVNSAFFDLRHPVSSPGHAVSLLGLDTVKALVLSAEVLSQLDQDRVQDFSLHWLRLHSVATGAIARQIVTLEEPTQKNGEQALTAGLLHDAGKLVLAANLPDRYRQVMALAHDRHMTMCAAEREVLGCTHAEIGAYLLGLWGLPEAIVEAVAFHHSPQRCLGTSFSPLTAVHVANALEGTCRVEGAAARADQIDTEYLDRLGLAHRLEAWRKISQQLGQDGDVR